MSNIATDQPAVPNCLPGSSTIPSVYTIGGRAAVYAYDLYKLWGGTKDRYFTDWMKARILKFGWLQKKQYVSFKSEGKRLLYILSLEAAIEAALNEPKGKGKNVAAALISVKRELKKQRLPTRGSLTDFITKDRPCDQQAQGLANENHRPATDLESRIAILEEAFKSFVTSQFKTFEQLNAVLGNLHSTNSIPFSLPQPEPETPSHSHEAPAGEGQQLEIASATTEESHEKTEDYVEPDSEPKLRDRIREAVNQYCQGTRFSHEETYSNIYARLKQDYGINASTFELQKGESILAACERLGHLDKVLQIVNEFQGSFLSSRTSTSSASTDSLKKTPLLPA
ncbi:hypothetical protein ACFPMF_15335 [Larkinella bovis]|uniref:AntA/AntB antirepressor domain-containing protein n=1 Tax=Larkinella bovis TaxID=683041 RepID=A0ABW0IB37_9BACT